MLFNVPQNTDVEDKIVGPFTAKQLGWLGGAGGIGAAVWTLVSSKIAAVLIILPLALFAAAAAFYRPYGQPFIGFIAHAFAYFFKPKVYIWKRVAEKTKKIGEEEKAGAGEKTEEKKETSLTDLQALAKALDSGGSERSDRIMEIIKNSKIKK